MTTEKDETFTILVKGRPLATVKADLIHAFLSVSIIWTATKVVVNVALEGRTDAEKKMTIYGQDPVCFASAADRKRTESFPFHLIVSDL